MSIFKLNIDIESLKQQLNEIEVITIDPIERIEQRKLIERKIKKLEQSKSQLEKLEKEKEELEVLKSEFLINDCDSGDRIEEENSSSVTNHSNLSKSNSDFDTTVKNNINNKQEQSNFERLNQTNYNKSQASIKIKYIAIFGIVFSSVIAIIFLINFITNQKAEQVRLQELARQQVILAQQETEKAKQQQAKAEQEKQEAIRAREEAEQARQAAIQAKQKADDLIQNNSYTKSTTTTSPIEFIKKYYSNINNRKYNLTWKDFTPKHRANPQSFYSYTAWWNSVKNTEIKQIKLLEQNEKRAIVYIELNYFMKTGVVYKNRKSKLYLIWDSNFNKWLIETQQQL